MARAHSRQARAWSGCSAVSNSRANAGEASEISRRRKRASGRAASSATTPRISARASCLIFARAFGAVGDLGIADRAEDLAHPVGDEIGAGQPEAVLAAEMIGDHRDIDAGRRGDLARRGRLEAFVAQELEGGGDERGAGFVAARLGEKPAWRHRCINNRLIN